MRKVTARGRRRGAGALAACLCPALVACGLVGGRRPAVVVDPAETARIRAEVEARLAAEPALGAREVRVNVEGRTVALHGAVDGIGALHCAIANAGLVPGVDNVVDFLVLRAGPREVRCIAPRAAGPSDARTPAAEP
ncbi:MAG TPA: BON domain-containing protein [Longimicrobiaceae bacterium]|nr:BON domain-containing protein [Longimicrobiaceae bacterium]